MSDPVLILMDYQEGICREDGPIGQNGVGQQVSERGVLQRAADMRDEFRAHDLAIIYVRVAFDPQYHRLTSASARFAAMKKHGLLQEGDPSTRICQEVEPRPEDPVVTKGCVNPFIGTNLEELLVRLQPRELVMGGVATNHVVEGAARHAADSGYRVTVIEDLCASFSPEVHEHSIRDDLPFYASIQTSSEYLEGLDRDHSPDRTQGAS